jgi:hypothetical protein
MKPLEAPAKSLWVTPIRETDVNMRLRVIQGNVKYEAQVAVADFEKATVAGVGQVWVNKVPITFSPLVVDTGQLSW